MVDVIRGMVEDVVGKAKEVVGTVAGRNDWITEGQAQQDKAEALRNTSKRERSRQGACRSESSRGASTRRAELVHARSQGPVTPFGGRAFVLAAAQGLWPFGC